MSTSYHISSVNEIRYLNDKKEPYAHLEYDQLSSTIKITDKRIDFTLTFISRDYPDKMTDFWNKLIKDSKKKKLSSLETVINKMKVKFKIKD